MPTIVIRLLPLPSTDWFGNVTISCQESGIRAELCYRGNSFLRRQSVHRAVRGKIYMPLPSKDVFEISGYWDRPYHWRKLKTLIYDAKETLSSLKPSALIDEEGLSPMESTVIWSEVSQAIISRSWDKAREAKTAVEEKQRELARKRKSMGESWTPKHFTARRLGGTAHLYTD
ncbi:transfer/carrier protein [Lithospermum erythrorhizon]|uniref:Transfer/carrier protein n=1 Tax=Lithospermum erythrorhizon TaxID=34254 RepID=A0AAV3RE25_LITER